MVSYRIAKNMSTCLLSEINLKKPDKGTTTVIMDTEQKIEEGYQNSTR